MAEPILPENKPKQYIDLFDAIHKGATYRDLFEAEKETGLQVRPPSKDELVTNYPELKDKPEEVDRLIGELDGMMHVYKNQDWNPYETSTVYADNNPWGRIFAKEYGLKVSNYSVHDTKKSGPEFGIFDPATGFLQTDPGDASASMKNVYISADGNMRPLAEAAMAKGYLYRKLAPDGNSFFWQEAPQGTLVSSETIKGWFDRKIRSDNPLTTMSRNMWYGFGPLMVKGIAAGYGTIGSLTYRLSHDSTDEAYKELDWYQSYVNMTNWANSVSTQNIDEKKRLFDNTSSFLAQVFNGVGQLAGMILTGGAVGAGVRALGAGAIWTQRLATQASLFAGDLQSMSMFQEQFQEGGLDYMEAARNSIPYGIATHLSEMIIPVDERLGGQLVNKLASKGGAKKLTSQDFKKIFQQKYGEKVNLTGKTQTELAKSSKIAIANKVYNSLTKGPGELIKLMDSHWAYRVGIGSVVEMVEEDVEGLMHTGLSSLANGYYGNWADRFANTFGSYDIVKNPDNGLWEDSNGITRGNTGAPYMLVNRYDANEFKPISLSERNQFERKQELANSILSGKKVIEDDFDWDQGWAAFFSTLITMGVVSPMIGNKSSSDPSADMQFSMFARMVADNPALRVSVEKELTTMVQKGEIGKNYMTTAGEVIKDGTVANSQAGELVSMFLDDLDIRVGVIQKYGLNSPQVALATDGIPSLIDSAVKSGEVIDHIDASLEELANGKKVTPKSVSFSKEPVVDGTETKEELKEEREEYVKKMRDIIEPKTDVIYDKNGSLLHPKKSLAYTNLFLQFEAIKDAMSRQAEDQAILDVRTKMRIDDENYGDEVKKITNEYLEKFNKSLTLGEATGIFSHVIDALKLYDFEDRNSFINHLDRNFKAKIDKYNQEITKPMEDRSFDILSESGPVGFERVMQHIDEAIGLIPDMLTNKKSLSSTKENISGLISQLSESLNNTTSESFTTDQQKTLKDRIERHIEAINNQRIAFKEQIKDGDEISAVESGASLVELRKIQESIGSILNVETGKKNKITTVTELLGQDPNVRVDIIKSIVDRLGIRTNTKVSEDMLWKFLSDNEIIGTTVLNNPVDVLKKANEFYKRVRAVELAINMNKTFFQDNVESNPQAIEHTKLWNNEFRLTDIEINRINNNITEIKSQLRSIIIAAENDERIRSMEKIRVKLQHMEMQYSFLRFIFEKDKDIPEFAKAITDLQSFLAKNVEKDDAATHIRQIWMKYQNATKTTRDEMELKIITELEKHLVATTDTLSGKLKDIEEEVIKNWPMTGYAWFSEFTDKLIVDMNTSDGFGGVLTVENYEEGKATYGIKNAPLTTSRQLFFYYTLNMLHLINTLGETGKGTKFSYKEVRQAYRDFYQKHKLGKIGLPFIFPSSYEQQEIIIQAVIYSLSPGNEFIAKTRKDVSKTLMPNTVVIRGYTGVGKSTQAAIDIAGTRKELTGKFQNVLVVVPNQFYQDNYESLSKSMGGLLSDSKFTIIKESDFIKNNIKEKYDYVVVEEASAWSIKEQQIINRRISKAVSENKGMTFFMIGDSEQLPNFEDSDAFGSYIDQLGMRLLPMVTIFRSGIRTMHSTLAKIRSSNSNEMIDVGELIYDTEDGVRFGIYSHQSQQELIADFLDRKKLPGQGPQDSILVVFDKEEMEYVLEKYPEVKDYESSIRTCVKDPSDSKRWFSGEGHESVFLYTNVFDEGNKKIYPGNRVGNSSAKRILITTLGRAQGSNAYVAIVSTVKSIAGNIQRFSEIEPTMNLNDMMNYIATLREVAPGDEYLLKVPKGEENYDFNRNTNVNNEKDVYQKTKEFLDSLKKPHTGEEQESRVTAIIHQEAVEEGILPEDETDRMNYNARFSQVFQKAILSIIDNKNHPLEEVVSAVEELNKVIVSEKMRIDNPIAFAKSMIKSITTDPQMISLVKSKLSVLLPEIKSKDGTYGHPFLINIVGYTYQDGKVSPIVDIYDLEINNRKNTILDLDARKLGTYAAILLEQGYKINNINVFNYESKPGFAFSWGVPMTLSDDMKTKYIKDGFERIGTEATTPLVSEEEFYQNERIIPDENVDELFPGSDMYYNTTWVNMNTGQMAIIKNVTAIYEESKMIYHVYLDGYEDPLTVEEFQNQYFYQSKFRLFNKFVETAHEFSNNNILYSSGAVYLFPLTTTKYGIPYNENDFYAKDSALVNVRKIINRRLMPGTILQKKYFESINAIVVNPVTGVVNRNETKFSNVIINMIPQDKMDAFFEGIMKDVKKEIKRVSGEQAAKAVTKEWMEAQGLHYISIDSEPEFDFSSKEDKGKTVRALDKFSELRDYVDGKKNYTTDELEAFFRNNGAFISDKKFRDILIDLNVYRLKLLRQLIGGEEVFVEIKKITEGNALNKFSDDEAITWDQLLSNAERYGFRVHPIESRLVKIPKINGRKRFIAKLSWNNEKNGSEILLDAAPLFDAESLSGYVTDIIREFEETINSLEFRQKLSVAEKLLMLPEEERSEKELDEALKQAYAIYEETQAYNFITINEAFFKRYPEFSKLIYFNQKGFLNISTYGSLTDKSGNPITTVEAKSKAILFVLKEILKMKDTLNLKNQPMRKAAWTGHKGQFITENIVTKTYGLSQKSFYLSIPDERPGVASVDEEKDSWLMPVGSDGVLTDNFVDKEVALDQIRDILGVSFKNVDFVDMNRIMEMPASRQFYGMVLQAFISLSEHNGMVNPYAGRHESMHIITEYVITAEAREQLLADIKQHIVKIGRAVDVTEITDKQAIEYIASIFQDKSYRGRGISGFVKRILDWITMVINRIRGKEYSMVNVLYDADRGVFRDHQFQNLSNFTSEYLMPIENEYNSPEVHEKLTEIFKTQENINRIKGELLAPMFIKHYSEWSKDMAQGVDPAWITVTKMYEDLLVIREKILNEGKIQSANVVADEQGERLTDIVYNEKNRKTIYLFDPNSVDGIRTEDVFISHITPEQYDLMQMARTKSGEFRISNEKILRQYEIIHMVSNKTLFFSMMQDIFGNIRLDKLIKSEGLTFDEYTKTIFKLQAGDFNDTNHVGNRSFIVNIVLNTIPKWKVSADGIWKKYDENKRLKHGFCETAVLDKMLLRSVQKILNRGEELTFDAWMNELRMLKKSLPTGNEKNLLQSFLFEIGDEAIYTNADSLIAKNKINNRTSWMFEGIGMLKLVDDFIDPIKRNYMRAYIDKTGMDEADYMEKIFSFWNLLNALMNHYESLYEKEALKFTVSTMGRIETTEYKDLHRSGARSNIKNSIGIKLMDASGTRINDLVRQKLNPGERQWFEVSADGIVNTRTGKQILEKGVFDITVTNAKDLFDFLGIFIYPEQIKTLHDENLLGSYKEIGQGLYYMMLSVKVNIMLSDAVDKMVTDELNKELIHQKLNEDKITNGLWTILMNYYKDNSDHPTYSINTIYNIDNTTERVAYPSPPDQFKFLGKIADATEYNYSKNSTDATRNVENNISFKVNRSSTLFDLFATVGQMNYDGSNIIVKRILKKIQEEGGVLLNNKNNMLLANNIKFDRIMSTIDGITAPLKGVKFENMSDADKYQVLIEKSLEEILYTKEMSAGFAILETFSDRAIYPNFPRFFYQKNGKDVSLVDKKYFETFNRLRTLQISTSVLIDQLEIIKRYYEDLKKYSKENWNAYKSGKKELKDLVLYRDYIIKNGTILPGNAITQTDNPIADINITKLRDMSTLEADKAIYAAFSQHINLSLQKIADSAHNLSAFEVSLFDTFELTDKFKNSLTPQDRIGIEEETLNSSKTLGEFFRKYEQDVQNYRDRLKELQAQRKKLLKLGKEEETKELLSKIYSLSNAVTASNEIRDDFFLLIGKEMKNNGYKQVKEENTTYHPLLEAIYWNHYFINEMVTPLVRGPVYGYKNFIDFIKRGTGPVAPGDKYATINEDDRYSAILDVLPKESRVVYLKDVVGLNTLFGKKEIKLTDGLSIMNPIYDRMLFLASAASAGTLGIGSKKNVNNYYSHRYETEIFHKYNQYPIPESQFKNSSFYQEMTRMMIGDELYSMLKTMLANNVPYYQAIDNLVRYVQQDSEGWNKKMVGYVVFSSAVKTGVTKVNDLKSRTGENVTLDNVTVPMELNSDENIVWVRNDTLRHQTKMRQNPFGEETSLPLQVIHVTGTFDHNKDINERYTDAIRLNIDKWITKIQSMKRGELIDYIRKNALRRGRNVSYAGKHLSLLNDPSVDINAIRSFAIQMFYNDAESALRFKLPGAFHVQAPSFTKIKMVQTKNGRSIPVLSNSDENLENDSVEGYRMIMPHGYVTEDGSEITSRDELDKNPKAIYRPAEVIAPFHHMDKFGLTPDITLKEAMTYVIGEDVYSLYDSGLKTQRSSSDEIYQELSKAFADPDISVDDIYMAFGSKMASVLRRKYEEYILEKDPAKEGTLEMSGKLLNKKHIISYLSRYYFAFNEALNVFIVRIPTTNSNMGSLGRIVAFANDAENLIYLSPERNQLDNSDYDGDSVNIIYHPIKDDASIDTENIDQIMFFRGIQEYYNNYKNHPFILTALETDTLENFAESLSEDKPQDLLWPFSNFGKIVENDRIIYDGKVLVGHFANLNNFFTTLFTIPKGKRTELFGSSTFLGKDVAIPETFAMIAKLVQAATVNAGLGGALGRLNINVYTSPLIAGLLFSGLNSSEQAEMDKFETVEEKQKYFEERIYKILTSPAVVKATAKTINANRATSEFTSKIWKYLTGVETVEGYSMQELKNIALKGEQVRRLINFIAIEKSIGGNIFELTGNIKNVEKWLGMDLSVFLSNIDAIRKKNTKYVKTPKQQAEYFIENFYQYSSDKSAKNKMGNEINIRNTFNIAEVIANIPRSISYLDLMNQLEKSIKRVFLVDQNIDILTDLVREKTQRNELWGEDEFNPLVDDFEKFIIGNVMENETFSFEDDFMNELGLKNGVFTMDQSEYGRGLFMALAPQYLSYLKQYDAYKNNLFVQEIERTSNVNLSEQIQFSGSLSIDDHRRNVMIIDFRKLNPKHQQFFRLYSALNFGFEVRNGSFNSMIDNNIERQYGEFVRKDRGSAGTLYNPDMDYLSDEIIRKNGILTKYDRTNKSGAKFTRRNKDLRIRMMLMETDSMGEVKKSVNPYPFTVNPYFSSSSNVPYLTGKPIGSDKIVKFHRDGIIKLSFDYEHGVFAPEAKTMGFQVKGGDTVVLSDSSHARVVWHDKYNIDYVKEKKNDTLSSRLRKDNRLASEMIDGLIYFINKAFPNIKFILTSNSDPTNPNRSDIAFIYNGKVYINTDRIQKDTPIHEIAHIVILIMKSISHPSYESLRSEALRIINSNNEEAKLIKAAYPYLSGEDLVDEVISNIAGWKSESDVADFLNSWKSRQADRKMEIWNSVKDFITSLWNALRNFFYTIFGLDPKLNLNISPEMQTLEQFAKVLTDAVFSGKSISSLNSEKLMQLQSGVMLSSKSVNPVVSLKNFHDVIYLGEANVETRRKLQIRWLKDVIRNNKNDVPIFISPGYGKFGDLDDPKNQPVLENLFDQYEAYKNNFGDKVIEYLMGGRKEIDTFVNDMGDTVSRYTDQTTMKFKRSIGFSRHSKYMRYSKLKDNKNLKHLYDENYVFPGFDPIVSIDYTSDKGIGLSIYDVQSGSLGAYDTLTPKNSKMFHYIIDKRTAVRKGINIDNKEIEFHKLYLMMLAQKFVEDKKVVINDMGVVQLYAGKHGEDRTGGGVSFEQIDNVALGKTMLNIGKVPEIMEILKGSPLSERFDQKNIRHITQDYIASLKAKKDKEGVGLRGITVNTRISDAEKISVLSRQLRRLQKKISDISIGTQHYSIDDIEEMRMIIGTIFQIRGIPVMDYNINQYMDLDQLRLFVTDTSSIGQEDVQKIRRFGLDIFGRVINNYNQMMLPLKEKDGVFDYIYKEFAPLLTGRVLNISDHLFDRLYVQEKGLDGKMHYTGHIYWTDDVNDPHIRTAWEREMAKKAKELGLSKELLAAGRKIVNVIEQALIYNLTKHYQNEPSGYLMAKDQLEFTEDDAKAMLFSEESTYVRGMIPILPQSAGEKFSQGKIYAGMKARVMELTDVYSQYSESSRAEIDEIDDLNKMRDMFFWQFGITNSQKEKYGNTRRSYGLLGLGVETVVENGVNVDKYVLKDEEVNKNISKNLEMLMNYFVMSSIRNGEIEENLLPTINAMKIVALNDRVNKDYKNLGVSQFLELFDEQAIRGKRKKITPKEVDTTLQILSSVAAPLVMAFNINIPIISLVTNGMYAFVEGITSNIAKKGGFDKKYFGSQHLLKSTAAFLTKNGFKKMTQLAMHDFQLVSSNDYELINLPIHQKTKKSIFTRFYVNWGNWATDVFARCVAMGAQMMHDGSWDAYDYDEKTGTVTYDPKKDKRLGWNGKDFSEAGKAYMEWQKKRAAYENTVGPVKGYTLEEARLFKVLSDKYIIGAYDNKTRSLWANYMIGKMFLMFKQWMITRFENAFAVEKTLDEGGKVEMIKDENGEWTAQWERVMVDGTVSTVYGYIRDSILAKKPLSLKNLSASKKYAMTKATMNLAMYTFMYFLFAQLVDQGEDEDKDKPIPNWRIVKNFRYAYQSLLVWPMMIEGVTRPFPAVDILAGFWQDMFGNFKLKNAPFANQGYDLIEPLIDEQE